MASIHIPADLEKELERAVRESGKSKEIVVREALIRYFEDVQDLAAAEEALKEPGRSMSLDELERNLGLDH